MTQRERVTQALKAALDAADRCDVAFAEADNANDQRRLRIASIDLGAAIAMLRGLELDLDERD